MARTPLQTVALMMAVCAIGACAGAGPSASPPPTATTATSPASPSPPAPPAGTETPTASSTTAAPVEAPTNATSSGSTPSDFDPADENETVSTQGIGSLGVDDEELLGGDELDALAQPVCDAVSETELEETFDQRFDSMSAEVVQSPVMTQEIDPGPLYQGDSSSFSYYHEYRCVLESDSSQVVLRVIEDVPYAQLRNEYNITLFNPEVATEESGPPVGDESVYFRIDERLFGMSKAGETALVVMAEATPDQVATTLQTLVDAAG